MEIMLLPQFCCQRDGNNLYGFCSNINR